MPSPRVNRRLAIGVFLTLIMGVVMYQPLASFLGMALQAICVDDLGNPCPASAGILAGGIGQLGPLMGDAISGVVAGGGASSDPCGQSGAGAGAGAPGGGGVLAGQIGQLGPLMGDAIAGVVAGQLKPQYQAVPLQLNAGQLIPKLTHEAIPVPLEPSIYPIGAPGPLMGTNAGVVAGQSAGTMAGGGASSNPCPSSASAGSSNKSSQGSNSSCNLSCGNKCYKVNAACTACVAITPPPKGCSTTGNIGGPSIGGGISGMGGGQQSGGGGGFIGGFGGGQQAGGAGGRAGGAGGVPGGAAGGVAAGATGGHAGATGTNGGIEGPIGGNGGDIAGPPAPAPAPAPSPSSGSSASSQSSSSNSSSSQSSGASQSSIIGGPPPPPGGSSAASSVSTSSTSSRSSSTTSAGSSSSTQTFVGSCENCKLCGPKGFCSASRCAQIGGYLCQFNEGSGLCEPLPPPFCPGGSSSSVSKGSSSSSSSTESTGSSTGFSSSSSYSSSSTITYYSSSFSSVPGCTALECGQGGNFFCSNQEPPKDCVLDFSNAPSCFRCDEHSSSSSSSEEFSSIPFTDIGGVNGIASGTIGGPMGIGGTFGGLGPAPAAGTFGGLGGPAPVSPQYTPPVDLRFCGNGRIDAGEYCDAGRDNSDILPNHCRTNCIPPHCGDRIVDDGLGEQCDDGSLNNTTASLCSAMCTFVSPSAPENIAMTIDLPLLPGQIPTMPTSNVTASVTPISIMHPPVGQTGPAALAAMAAGAAAGWSWLRRRKLKMSS